MLKEGKFRALRNMPVGWVTQALHSTDKSEILFRVIVEIFFMLSGVLLFVDLNCFGSMTLNLVLGLIIIHTLNWFLTGNFWVYMLDSFKAVKNPGINSVVRFTQLTRKFLIWGDFCEAILIYGSMCRCEFHIRSDLDLRVVRRTDSFKGLFALPIAYLLRTYSFFVLMPVDLQVVDSYGFLSKQMREDEKPIIVYERKEKYSKLEGMPFELVIQSPNIVLKETK